MAELWSPLLLWSGLAALLLFWSVGAYNRLVRLRAKVLSIFGSLATQCDRYAAWMAEHAPTPAADAAAPPVGDVWTNLRAATAQFTASLAAVRSNPQDTEAMAALAAGRTVLLMAWQYVGDATLAQSRGDEGPAAIRAEWEAITAHTQSAEKAFAVAVDVYNRAVRQFPAVLLAWVFGFKPLRSL